MHLQDVFAALIADAFAPLVLHAFPDVFADADPFARHVCKALFLDAFAGCICGMHLQPWLQMRVYL